MNQNRANRANNALRIFSQAGTLRPENARALSLVSKNARQSALNMVNVIKIDCSKPDCIEKLNSKIATFARATAVHIKGNDGKNKTFINVLAILKSRNINIQELHIILDKSHGITNQSLPEHLGEGLCKKIRNFRLSLGDYGMSGVNISFIEKFVNLDTLTLDKFKLSKDAPKLPNLSTLMINACSNFSHLLSANRTSLKRFVLARGFETPFQYQNHHNSNSNNNNRTRASTNADSIFNNLEFLQITDPSHELSLTSILKQCPKLKILIVKDATLIASKTDVTDNVTFLALETTIYKEVVDAEGHDVMVQAGLVKIKEDQYMIKTFANNYEGLEKMKEKLNMYEIRRLYSF